MICTSRDNAREAIKVGKGSIHFQRSHTAVGQQGTLRVCQVIECGILRGRHRREAAPLCIHRIEVEEAPGIVVRKERATDCASELLTFILRLYQRACDGTRSGLIVRRDGEGVRRSPGALPNHVKGRAVKSAGSSLRDSCKHSPGGMSVQRGIALSRNPELLHSSLRKGELCAWSPSAPGTRAEISARTACGRLPLRRRLLFRLRTRVGTATMRRSAETLIIIPAIHAAGVLGGSDPSKAQQPGIVGSGAFVYLRSEPRETLPPATVNRQTADLGRGDHRIRGRGEVIKVACRLGRDRNTRFDCGTRKCRFDPSRCTKLNKNSVEVRCPKSQRADVHVVLGGRQGWCKKIPVDIRCKPDETSVRRIEYLYLCGGNRAAAFVQNTASDRSCGRTLRLKDLMVAKENAPKKDADPRGRREHVLLCSPCGALLKPAYCPRCSALLRVQQK